MRKIMLRFMVASLLLAATFVSPQSAAAQQSCTYPFLYGESCVIAGYRCNILPGGTTIPLDFQCPGDLVYYACATIYGTYFCVCTAEGLCG